ncbi:aminopeptidase P family protein [Rhodococcus triatomae]|uniref:Xaa-Pro dipeptidase n=1 Tax=Rhodococcus triatomae TaxID=300028 RepID=A0A1G8KGS7_9NOCA|nr:Xaa-Pro peptidase family protein [Rhodococcus triatomae]QNG18921.1 aminopeptidase P family protein [Rhodococcus triatomae]QNG25167.1 aminopeptidase P family protein [Rhodococcus triatomae]SDI42616.1 Xaa-Pro dipeptidase [Rhodococcus triatomae]
MPADFGRRREALRRVLADQGCEAILVTDLLNIRYLTGFTGSQAALLVRAAGEDGTVVCTDGRYVTQVAEQVPDLPAEIARASAVHLLEKAVADGVGSLGFESHVVTVDQFRTWEPLVSPSRLVSTPHLVEALRAIKDEFEIGRLRAACACADAALADLLDQGGLRPGRTEKQVRRDLENLMFDHGADAVSFETIVATGANSAVPHHRPTDAVLAHGDFVKLDFGARIGGYHSDMTRTYVLGAAAQWQRDVYELVARSQAAGRAALVPGTEVAAVDGAARRVIADAGYGDLFVHGLGHGVGLEIHEAPGIGQRGTGTLSVGAAVTVEPGVYFSGRGGVRIEDTLVVREQGPELLTLTDKELTVV